MKAEKSFCFVNIYGKFSSALKVSVFGVILVRIFPVSFFPYSVQMRKNADQNYSEYELFLRKVRFEFSELSTLQWK